MSTAITILPGEIIPKDPNEEIVVQFDWTDHLADAAEVNSSEFRITGPDVVLTKDNPSIVVGGKKTQVRVKAGTLGKEYRLTNKIVTNESPTQTIERSCYVDVEDQ